MNTISRYEHDVMPGPSMKGPMITSAMLHIILFVVAAVGLPFMAKDTPIITNAINIEVLDISDVTQTNVVAQPQKKAEAPEKPEPAPAPKKPEIKPELKVPEPPKIEEENAEKPKEKPKLKPKEKPKEKPKKDTKSALDSLLNNLAPDAEERKPKPEVSDAKTEEQGAPVSQIAQLGETLTISEQDAIGQQLYPCWNVPAGARFAEDLAIEIRVFMNPDGSIRDTQILDQGRYNRDPHFRAAADSANRALRNPRCVPLSFPLDKYDQLKRFVFNFDPKDML